MKKLFSKNGGGNVTGHTKLFSLIGQPPWLNGCITVADGGPGSRSVEGRSPQSLIPRGIQEIVTLPETSTKFEMTVTRTSNVPVAEICQGFEKHMPSAPG